MLLPDGLASQYVNLEHSSALNVGTWVSNGEWNVAVVGAADCGRRTEAWWDLGPTGGPGR